MMNQYNIANHSILPLIFKIMGPHSHITYLIKEPATKSLFMLNPLASAQFANQNKQKTSNKYHSWLIQHIRNIQKLTQSKLTHVLSNHAQQAAQYQIFMEALLNSQGSNRKQIKYVKPERKNANDIKPEVIGQISVCYIGAQGYTPDYNLIGVTHISPTSTKVPVLFVDQLIGVCRVDYLHDQLDGGMAKSDQGYLKTLDKVKYFPNQTYIFPSHAALHEDLLFCKAIIDTDTSSIRPSALINQKIELFIKNHKNVPDCLIPTTVVEQKFMNPFFYPEKYSKLLNVDKKDKTKCFSLLRAMRKEWKKGN